MGIHGLWDELSPASERKGDFLSMRSLTLALAKLAMEAWEAGEYLKVAIDTSIWAFQIQSGQKGSNPALRTFYYRLCLLLMSNMQPIFVFDGPHKPPFKRNHPTLPTYGERANDRRMKQLIRAFGFVAWDAPGEAEAECALLQKKGLVDLIITEDVDSLMFGATKVARVIPDNKKRSHAMVYSDVERITGLGKDEMVLCAMLSGGDYLPEGIPNCGPKIAAEVSRPVASLSIDSKGGARSLFYEYE